jgi:hypothetical protein
MGEPRLTRTRATSTLTVCAATIASTMLASPATALAAASRAIVINQSINRVGLGATERSVQSRLGRPTRTNRSDGDLLRLRANEERRRARDVDADDAGSLPRAALSPLPADRAAQRLLHRRTSSRGRRRLHSSVCRAPKSRLARDWTSGPVSQVHLRLHALLVARRPPLPRGRLLGRGSEARGLVTAAGRR